MICVVCEEEVDIVVKHGVCIVCWNRHLKRTNETGEL